MWYIAVAPPSDGAPRPEDLEAFEVPDGTFVKLNEGVWHAGRLLPSGLVGVTFLFLW